ncbi:MAG: PEP-CTERM sorting domain-containing protein [Phycisphaerales bacterium JB063]
MRTPSPFVLAAFGTLSLVMHSGAAAADYDESIDGEISGDETSPTALVLELGTNTITGTTVPDPLDRDFVTFTLGPGQSLDSLILTAFTGQPESNEAFMAIDDQLGFDSLFDTTDFLGTTLIGQADIGSDALDLLGATEFGGEGFTGPLGEGTYTIWFQETGGPTSYTFTATVVPEPGSAAALLLGAGGLMIRRRRAR